MSASPPVEGMTMAMDVVPPRGEISWATGEHPGRTALGNLGMKLLMLPVVMTVGFVTWEMLSGPSDAESQRVPAPSSASLPESADTLRSATSLETPAEEATPAEAAAVDGLTISSQSWRRAGLGSNAQVTFTLRNANDYAVRDIEISCSFTREDGSHLTDRTRTIHDTVNMKSHRTFARVHVGFVNVNADKAKCSPITASRG
jgi:hypothetical protein